MFLVLVTKKLLPGVHQLQANIGTMQLDVDAASWHFGGGGLSQPISDPGDP